MLEVMRNMRQTVGNTKWFAYAYFMLPQDGEVLHHILMMACLLNTEDVEVVKEVFNRLHEIEPDAAARIVGAGIEDPQLATMAFIDYAMHTEMN